MQAASAQSSLDRENITPHQSAKQETANRPPSQEPAQKQIQQQQQSQQSQQGQQGQQSQQGQRNQQNQQNQNQNVLPRETKPTAGQNGRTHQDSVAVDDKDSMFSQGDPPSGIKKQVPSVTAMTRQAD